MKKRAQRLLDLVAPVRPPGADRGYRRLLRWASLPVTDRRWAAPLAALALGFGLFAGVAIGPGATGTLATGAPQVIELPSLLAGGDGEEEAGAASGGESGGSADSAGAGSGEAAFPEEEASAAAFESSFAEEAAPEAPAPEPAPSKEPEDEAEDEEEAQPMGGVVVHTNPAAGSYTVVETGGLMNAIHATKLPTPGTKVSVPVRTLANGTFAEQGKRKQIGTRTSATLAGIVTFVDTDPAAPAYAVSKRGSSVLIHVRPDPTGAPVALPQRGAYAVIIVDIEKTQPTVVPLPTATEAPAPPPTVTEPAAVLPVPAPACAPDAAQPPVVPAPTAILWQRSIEADGAPFASSDFAGVVSAICPATAQLAISGDDLRQSGKDLVFTVPKSIDLGGLAVGDSVAATADFEADGSLTLTGLASDERIKGADDADAAQGDLASKRLK